MGVSIDLIGKPDLQDLAILKQNLFGCKNWWLAGEVRHFGHKSHILTIEFLE